ncbi:MAG: UDP-N-acetylglucosamine 1-carboxyvinyltransferase [Firmicutes bacterium]|nr:UDP-N-acetylglucosamine 1-carboxyvinyltransferase [Bacillota bacterium]
MAKFIVEKAGPLHGEVVISGAKNAVLPILAATVLTDEICTIYDVPRLRDVDVMCRILRSLGKTVEEDYGNHTVIVSGSVNTSTIPYELVKKMRASFFVMGPLVAKTGAANIAQPGGCSIGSRPIDLHIKGLRKLGAKVVIEESLVDASAQQLTGDLVYLDFPSVGATENIMMAAALAKGTSIIENAAEEPEIVDLANFLNKMGAKIKGAGTDSIRIEGVESLHGTKHTVIPDRIETGTFMVAAAISRGNVLVRNCVSDHVRPVIAKLIECGASVSEEGDGIRVNAEGMHLKATSVKTMPYPGFPTDMQAPFMALLTTVEGTSTVNETVFENRFMHADELSRMGANIRVDGRTATVPGDKRPLTGAKVVSTDLRGGAALVLAGLVAEGTTEVGEIYHIERGYERFKEKLNQLGAKVIRVEDPQNDQ